jgi:cytoskeletal protein CcmA (bactofilin family)
MLANKFSTLPKRLKATANNPPTKEPPMTDLTKKRKAAPSILSHDMHVVGQIVSDGDIQIECKLDGNLLSHAVTVGEDAVISGEICGEVVTIMGRVDGTIRGRQVHLAATSEVTGDIYHEALAIESGAHVDGVVKREKDPLSGTTLTKPVEPVAEAADEAGKTTH